MKAFTKAYISFAFTIIIAMGLLSLAYTKLYLPGIGQDETGILAQVGSLAGLPTPDSSSQDLTAKAKPAQSVKEWKKEYKDPLKSLSKGTNIDMKSIQDAAKNMDIDALSNLANEKDLETFRTNAQTLKKDIQSRSVPDSASVKQKQLMKDTDEAAVRLANAAERASELAPKAKAGDMLALAELAALGAKAQSDMDEINSKLSQLEE